MNHAKKKRLILKAMASEGVQVTPNEARDDQFAMTPEDYDDWIMKTLEERRNEQILPGFGDLMHPTSRLFQIGIESIRAGKPSELFILILELIGKNAKDTDVLSYVFREDFPRKIKTVSVVRAERQAKIVSDFKKNIGREIQKRGEKATYEESIKKFKAGRNSYEIKDIERALIDQGQIILELKTELDNTKDGLD